MATREEEALQRVARDPRRQWGWEPSPMASVEEQRAYQAYEMMPKVAAGTLPVSALPEAYGGRPTGTSRRAIRMAAEYDEARRQDLERQRVVEQLNLQQMAEARLQRAQDLELKKFGMAEGRETRVVNEADMIINSISGEIAPDGRIISNPIRPEDPQAIERLENLARLKFGMENKTAQDMWSTLYRDAFDFREKMANDAAAQARADAEARVGIAKELGAYGMSITDFTKDGKINFEKANEAIGKAWATGKEVDTEQAQTEEQRKSIASKITSAEQELLKVRARAAAAQRRVEARPTVKDFQTELEAAQIEQGILEDEVNRLNRIIGGGQPQATQPQTTGQRPALGDIFGGQ